MAETKGKRTFQAVLLSDPESRAPNATGILIPFSVLDVFGSKGLVPVRGTINGFAFRSSVAPMGEGKHYMAVNRQMREGAKAKAGDTVRVVMERDTAPREIAVPDDLERVLAANPKARASWDKLSYTHRKEHVQEVEGAKKPETRARRLARTLEMLTGPKAGKRS